jgi:hypothetical protein
MFLRRRSLLRDAVIGGGAYAAGRESAQRSAEQAQQDQQQRPQRAGQAEDEQNERIASPEQRRQAQQATGQPAAGDGRGRGGAVPKPSMLDQLNQLNRLHQQGALTDQEFSAAKAKLLSS